MSQKLVRNRKIWYNKRTKNKNNTKIIDAEFTKYSLIAVCALLALVPVGIWGRIFIRNHPSSKKIILLTFFGGALAVAPLLAYKYLWLFFPWLNAFIWTRNLSADVLGLSSFLLIPLPVLATFMFVGIIEESSKALSVRFINSNQFKSIDDVIELCIIAALGFAFIENIIYFYNIITVRGFDNLFVPFALRTTFSTFAHVMFSGIFGYYYGVGHFAGPILRKEMRQNRHPILKFMHKKLHLKKEVLFRDEKILEGLLFASVLHAFFNIFLEMGWAFLIVPFLFMGYLVLNYLLKKKENLKNYGNLASVRTTK